MKRLIFWSVSIKAKPIINSHMWWLDSKEVTSKVVTKYIIASLLLHDLLRYLETKGKSRVSTCAFAMILRNSSTFFTLLVAKLFCSFGSSFRLYSSATGFSLLTFCKINLATSNVKKVEELREIIAKAHVETRDFPLL